MTRALGVPAVVLTMLAGGLVAGCKAKTDMGETCVLVRKNPDGGTAIPITEDRITPGADFISFGAVECEDLVCVRDLNAPLQGGNVAASGGCSTPCVEGNDATCDTGDDAVDKSANRFVCRSLLLDTATLAALREQNPAEFQRYFGDTTSPFFCAKPLKVDGGS
jgi:hypothetical protein